MVTIHVDQAVILVVVGAVLLFMVGLIHATEAVVEGRRAQPPKWGALSGALSVFWLLAIMVGAALFLGGLITGFLQGVS